MKIINDSYCESIVSLLYQKILVNIVPEFQALFLPSFPAFVTALFYSITVLHLTIFYRFFRWLTLVDCTINCGIKKMVQIRATFQSSYKSMDFISLVSLTSSRPKSQLPSVLQSPRT